MYTPDRVGGICVLEVELELDVEGGICILEFEFDAEVDSPDKCVLECVLECVPSAGIDDPAPGTDTGTGCTVGGYP